MNNILDFVQYKEQVRIYEDALVKSQILEPIDESLRGKIRKKINAKAEVFVRAALADEIEMGRQLNEAIQEAVDELKEYIEKIQKFVDDSNPEKTELFKKIEKIFEDIHKSSFELLEILSGVSINFADYVQNATMATFVNFGVMFIPTRSIFLLKKSYKYFIGLIKNTIRKDLLMLMLNFDQFENTVLIQSLEDDEQNKMDSEVKTRLDAYDEFARRLIGGEGGKKRSLSKAEMDKITKVTRSLKDGIAMQMKLNDRRAGAIGFDTRYDNTYTKTLDQLKNFVLEDDSKYLEAIKSGMRTQALDEVDTKSYVELLISAAEECAYEVSNAIHTNFIEKVSVFKLANQKRLIELVKKDKELFEKNKLEEDKKREEELRKNADEKLQKAIEEEGPKIFKKVVEDNADNNDKQIEEFEKLDEVEFDGDKYNEKDILNGWLSLFDKESNKFKNWEEKKDQITEGLKLHLSEVVPNEDSFTKYANLLVDCLLPCACKKKEVIKRKRTVEMESISYPDGSAYTDTKEDDEPVKTTLENAFSVLALRKADSREKRLLTSIYEEDTSSTEDKLVFKKDDEDKFIVDEKKEKLLKSALKLISKNLVKLEEDVILEVIEGMFNEDNMTYQMSEEIMNDILTQFKKLKGLKENDYDTTVETKKDGEDEKETK